MSTCISRSARRLGFALASLFIAAGSLSALQFESAAGSTAASFGVGHGGDATYRVPIQVPPGTGGMEPRLALVYGSRGPDGPVGVGWSLEGLERISRCRPTRVQDGFSEPIQYDADDRFCLDGERLVAISGAYGADGTIHHTERESRARVTSFGVCGGAPCYWEVVRKDGRVLELGNSADSRVLRLGAGGVRQWAVNSVRDPNLNTMRISYGQVDGVAYPDVIRYTENDDGLGAGRSVRFVYAARAPSTPRFDQGSPVSFTRTLVEIQTSILEGAVRSYVLEYDGLAGPSAPRLERVTECAGGACLPPTTFEWSEPSPAIDAYRFNSVRGFDFGRAPRSFADVNGDGRADFCRILGTGAAARLSCALASVNGFEGELSSAAPFDVGYPDVQTFADVNGDGRADYCRTVGDPPDVFLSCALAGESGFGQYDFNSAPRVSIGRGDPFQRAFVDVNGDGRADFCRAMGDEAPVILSCLPADATGFGSAEITSLSPTTHFDWGYENFPQTFVDVDGDGQAEYCRAVGDGPGLFLSCAGFDGVGFEFYSINSAPGFDFGVSTEPRQFADANGDGLMDYCRLVGLSPHFSISCALGTGRGFGPAEFSSAPGIDLGFSDRPRAYLDVNGDGRADYCRFVGTEPNIFFSCAASREDGFGSYEFSAPNSTWTDPGYPDPRSYVRTSRGGGVSFCRKVGPHGDAVLSCAGMEPQGREIERIVDGYGQLIEISYGSLDDPWVYTPRRDAAYPQRDVRGGPQRVVMSYTRSSPGSAGAGALSYAYSYSYAGARVSADGRGWLGFQEIVRRDRDLGLDTVTHLLQDFPFTGLVEASTVFCEPLFGKDPACSTYSKVHRTLRSYVARESFDGVVEALRRHELSEAFEYDAPGTSRLRLFEYDAYGNLVWEQRTSSVAGGEDSHLFVHRRFFNEPSRNLFGFVTEEKQSLDEAGLDVRTVERRVYDPLHLNILEESSWDSTSDSFLTTAFTYDSRGNPTRIVEPGGGRRDLSYDPTYGTFLVSESMQAGPARPPLTTRYRFDPRFGLEVERIDPAGRAEWTEYDDFGRVRSVEGSHPDTGAPALLRDVSWTFDGDLAVRETRTALDWTGRVTTRRDTLDALGRVVRSTFAGADGVVRHQVVEHDSAGQIVARSKLFSDGGAPVFETHRFDSRGRPVESTTADGDRITYAYQAPARVRTVTSAGTGREKVRVIDYAARNGRLEPASVLHGNGQRIDFHRDALGRLLVASDASGGDLMRQSFDSLGRTVETWNQAAGSVHLAYGPDGLLQTRTASGPGSTRTYAYDGLGRLVQEVARAAGETETIDYAWDDAARGALGRLASIDSSKGWGYAYHYDAAGQVRRQDLRVQRRVWTLEQRFDPAGRPLSVRFPDGSATATAYGDEGTVESVDFTEVDGATRRLVEVTGRGADTRPSQLRLGPLTLSMEWTAEGLLDAREAHVPAGFVDQESVGRTSGRFVDGVTGVLAPIWDQSFTHDAAGQLVAAAGGYGAETFHYSDGGDLLERGGLHYGYDGAGRVVSVAAGAGGVPFTGAYDAGGRLVERHTDRGHDVLRYGARERLEEVKRNGATVATFLYDHRGRRLYKEESGVETFYIGEDYEETVHAGGTQWTRYLHAPEGGFATVSRGAEVGREGYAADGDQFFLTDHLGHVRRVFDGAGQLGTVVNYTPFGEMWRVDGPLSFRRGFAGLELDRSTGLYDNRARYYDAGLGRFITADSQLGGGVLEFSAFNRYAFGANDPTYFTDPTGYSFFDAIGDAFKSAADWVADNADVLAGLTVSVVQVGVGVAILAASPTLGKALIGAGFESGFYAATHFGDFSWDGYGNAQLAGVDRGLGISSKINAASKVASVLGAGAGSVASRAASAAVAGVDGAGGHGPAVVGGTGLPRAPGPGVGVSWGPPALGDDLPESASRGRSVTGPAFDLGQLRMSPTFGHL